jgi:predicted  nucleic acid-binding Zn-ribbon protein
MNKEKLKNFIDLVTFDQQFLDLYAKIHTLQLERQITEKQIDQLEQSLHDVKNKRHEVVKLSHEQELKLKDLDNEENRLSEFCKNIRNVKEYDAAQKELDRTKLMRNQQEQKIIQLSNKVESVNKELETFEEKYKIEKDFLFEKLNEQKNMIVQTESALSDLQKDREIKAAPVPVEWLQMYETMRGRVKNPVVPLEQDSCSACSFFMSSRDLHQLRQLGLLQCKDCYRFLYIKDDISE